MKKPGTTLLLIKIDMGLPFKDPVHYALILRLDEKRNVHEVRIVD